MLNLLAIWRAHGLDASCAVAWERGIVLAGQSAGAMCWFEGGHHHARPEPRGRRAGLGLLPGSLCVHYHRDPDRRSELLDQVAELGTTRLRGRRRRRDPDLGAEACGAVTAREDAAVWRVTVDETGRAGEVRMASTPLPSPQAGDRRAPRRRGRDARAAKGRG